jgi:IPT/TIG domain
MTRSTLFRLPVAFAAVVAVVAVAAGGALAANYVAKPSITGFSPGTAKAMAKVTVHGKNFSKVRSVRVDGKSMAFKVDSTTKIVLTLSSTAKSGRIAVVTSGGTAMSTRSLAIKA